MVLVETAFGKISRVIKAKNIKPEIAFKSFDLQNRSKLSAEELYKCFKYFFIF